MGFNTCMYVCVVTEMTNLGEISYFLLDTVLNVILCIKTKIWADH